MAVTDTEYWSLTISTLEVGHSRYRRANYLKIQQLAAADMALCSHSDASRSPKVSITLHMLTVGHIGFETLQHAASVRRTDSKLMYTREWMRVSAAAKGRHSRMASLHKVFRQLAARLSYCVDTSQAVRRLCCPTKPATRLLLISFVRCPLSATSYSERCRPLAYSTSNGQTDPDGTSMLLNVSSTSSSVCPTDILLSLALFLRITATSLVRVCSGDQKGFVYNEASWRSYGQWRPTTNRPQLDDAELIERNYESGNDNKVHCAAYWRTQLTRKAAAPWFRSI